MGLRTPIEDRLESRLTRIESSLEPLDREYRVSVTLAVKIPGVARTEFHVRERTEDPSDDAASGE